MSREHRNSEERKKRFKIYRLKDYILVHYLSPRDCYYIYEKGVEPHRLIDDVGRTTSDYKITCYEKDNYIVICPTLCNNFPILVNSKELKEVDLTNSKQLFELTEYLGYFTDKVNKEIKDLIEYFLSNV